MNSITSAAVALTGKAVFVKLVGEVYGFVCNTVGNKIKYWNTTSKTEKLYRKIALIKKVKTIWQIDKAIDLKSFYCDSHVIIDETRKKVNRLSDFNSQNNILIEGIAGQGKSILLRHLCYIELVSGNYIPIFIELNRISRSHSLKDRIFVAFAALGMTMDDGLFDALARSGKVVLLLDAFDEVPDELKSNVLTDIEDLASTKENLRIIVTSRPHSGIEMSNQLLVVKLDDLKGDEFAKVITKLAGHQSWAENLIDHINNRAPHIKELLCTPLMVTLLVLSYKSYKELPNRLSDFYDALFQTLLQRHDGTKPGFTRKRGCLLDDSQYRRVFEAFCILAKKTGRQTFDYNTVTEIAAGALKQVEFSNSAQCYVDDIVKITCLIIHDGEEYRFIHKTDQEYYTASFIANKPDLWAKQFYRKIIVGLNIAHREWHQELAFLSEIDTFRYDKYYTLPALLSFLDISEQDLELPRKKVTLTRTKKLLDPLKVEMKDKDFDTSYHRLHIFDVPSPFFVELISTLLNKMEFDEIAEAVLEKKVKLPQQRNIFPSGLKVPSDGYHVPFFTFVTQEIEKVHIQKIVDDCLALFFDKAKKIKHKLCDEENPSLLDGLL